MTRIDYTLTKHWFDISVDGHAGTPQLCSAVSMLSCTFIEQIKREDAAGRAKIDFLQVADGKVSARIRLLSERARAVADTIIAGFDILAHNHQKNFELRGRNSAE